MGEPQLLAADRRGRRHQPRRQRALAGPAQSAFGRPPPWGTSALIVAAIALVLLIPDIRRLRRRDTTEAVSADAEGAGRGLG
ncbi:hypothetical protein [Streptomyces griseoluteus]